MRVSNWAIAGASAQLAKGTMSSRIDLGRQSNASLLRLPAALGWSGPGSFPGFSAPRDRAKATSRCRDEAVCLVVDEAEAGGPVKQAPRRHQRKRGREDFTDS